MLNSGWACQSAWEVWKLIVISFFFIKYSMVELVQGMAAFFNVFICWVFWGQSQQICRGSRRLQIEMGMDHPSIWKLIDVLRKIEKARDSDQLMMNAGYLLPQKQKRKYTEADDRIKRLVMRFIGNQAQSMIDSLRGVSHNFEMDP